MRHKTIQIAVILPPHLTGVAPVGHLDPHLTGASSVGHLNPLRGLLLLIEHLHDSPILRVYNIHICVVIG